MWTVSTGSYWQLASNRLEDAMSARRRSQDGRHIEIAGIAVSAAVAFAAISELAYVRSPCLVTEGGLLGSGSVVKAGAIQ